ncbi:MAG: protein kinase [Chloroflexota bacterium]
MTLETGSILNNRYRIEGQLGKGGMGAVYLAYDQTLELRVALKENLNPNPESESQFRREAKLLASLRHPNLPRVTDHFILADNQYLVMDFIEGEDLQTHLVRQRPDTPEVIRWADDVCEALTFLHTRQPPIIHRDLKPGNLKLQPNGRVVLVDFGIAKAFTQDQTATGARGMTPGFSPPEQFGGSGTDTRSDQYALAATLYYLMTGKQPANSIDRMLKQDDLKPPRQLNPNIPVPVEAALLHGLALRKDDRFPDVATFKDALHGGVDFETVRAGGLPREGRRRLPVAPFAGLGLLALILIGGVALARGGQQPQPSATSLPAAILSTATPSLLPAETALPTPTPTIAASSTSIPTDTSVPTASPVPVVIGGSAKIAFVSDRAENLLQVWTINPDGGDPRQLTFDPGDKIYPTWSPNGSRLLYVAPGGIDQAGNDLGLDIWIINADGTGIEKVITGPGDDTEPAWSPDGSWIAFSSTRANKVRQVFLLDAACLDQPGGCADVKPHNLSCHPDFCAVEFSPAWAPPGLQPPAWLPSSFSLAVLESINEAPAEIYFRPPAVEVPIDFDRRDQVRGLADLAWSPDGTYFAFTWSYQRGANEIYVAPVADRGATWERLTSTNGNREPAFSPDGQWIAFSTTRDGKPEIYLMTIGGANQINLTSSPATRELQPDWQPYAGS